MIEFPRCQAGIKSVDDRALNQFAWKQRNST